MNREQNATIITICNASNGFCYEVSWLLFMTFSITRPDCHIRKVCTLTLEAGNSAWKQHKNNTYLILHTLTCSGCHIHKVCTLTLETGGSAWIQHKKLQIFNPAYFKLQSGNILKLFKLSHKYCKFKTPRRWKCVKDLQMFFVRRNTATLLKPRVFYW